MNCFRYLLPLLLFTGAIAFSQPSPIPRPMSDIPLTLFDGQTTVTNRLGVFPGAHFCIVPEDSVNGHQEFMLPPDTSGVV
jgi:hypothetical protein